MAIDEAMEQRTISISKAGITAVQKELSAVPAVANSTFGRFLKALRNGVAELTV